FSFRQGDPGGKGKDDPPAPKVSGRLTPEKAAAEHAEIRKAIDAFTTAYNKGDLDGVLAIWTDDAEYISDTGKTYSGKPQLRLVLKKALGNAKESGSKQSIRVLSLRFVKPDVAVEQGEVVMRAKDGSEDVGKYESLWLKLDGKWYLSRVRDMDD